MQSKLYFFNSFWQGSYWMYHLNLQKILAPMRFVSITSLVNTNKSQSWQFDWKPSSYREFFSPRWIRLSATITSSVQEDFPVWFKTYVDYLQPTSPTNNFFFCRSSELNMVNSFNCRRLTQQNVEDLEKICKKLNLHLFLSWSSVVNIKF